MAHRKPKIEGEQFYTLWDLHPNGRTWMIDRSYSAAYFMPGSYGNRFLSSKKHQVLSQGIDPNKTRVQKKGKPHREPVDNFSVRVQQTSGSWRTVQSGMRQAEAKKEAQRLAHDYWYAAVFKGRKKHWSPKE